MNNNKMEKILVVEDEENIRETLQDLLECSGYKVVTANDGEAGFFKVLKESPDLIISDLMMPKMSGFDLLEAVRSYGKSKFTPFIILSAKSEGSDIRSGMNLGADDYIMKPFDHKDLLSSIHYRLSHRDELIRLIKQAENERMRMDIHDNVQQTVVSLRMGIERLIDSDQIDPQALKTELLYLKKGLDVAFLQIRNLINGNASHDLLTKGFRETLSRMIANFQQYTQIEITDSYQWIDEPPLQQSVELIPVISELMTNIVKHAGANQITVTLEELDGTKQLIVTDNGVGFDVAEAVNNGGLRNLFMRVEKIGGELDIHSKPGEGTSNTIVLK